MHGFALDPDVDESPCRAEKPQGAQAARPAAQAAPYPQHSAHPGDLPHQGTPQRAVTQQAGPLATPLKDKAELLSSPPARTPPSDQENVCHAGNHAQPGSQARAAEEKAAAGPSAAAPPGVVAQQQGSSSAAAAEATTPWPAPDQPRPSAAEPGRGEHGPSGVAAAAAAGLKGVPRADAANKAAAAKCAKGMSQAKLSFSGKLSKVTPGNAKASGQAPSAVTRLAAPAAPVDDAAGAGRPATAATPHGSAAATAAALEAAAPSSAGSRPAAPSGSGGQPAGEAPAAASGQGPNMPTATGVQEPELTAAAAAGAAQQAQEPPAQEPKPAWYAGPRKKRARPALGPDATAPAAAAAVGGVAVDAAGPSSGGAPAAGIGQPAAPQGGKRQRAMASSAPGADAAAAPSPSPSHSPDGQPGEAEAEVGRSASVQGASQAQQLRSQLPPRPAGTGKLRLKQSGPSGFAACNAEEAPALPQAAAAAQPAADAGLTNLGTTLDAAAVAVQAAVAAAVPAAAQQSKGAAAAAGGPSASNAPPPAAKVPSLFMTVGERRELKRRQDEEKQLQEEEARRAKEEAAAAAALEKQARAAEQRRQQEERRAQKGGRGKKAAAAGAAFASPQGMAGPSRGPAAIHLLDDDNDAPGTSATPRSMPATQRTTQSEAASQLPTNPFFTARKKAAGSGTGLKSGIKPGTPLAQLPPALPPIHVTQAEPLAPLEPPPAARTGLFAQLMVPRVQRQPVAEPTPLVAALPPPKPILMSRLLAAPQPAAADGGDGGGAAAPGQLLQQLAAHTCAEQARRAADAHGSQDAQLMDVGSPGDVLSQLSQRLARCIEHGQAVESRLDGAAAGEPVGSSGTGGAEAGGHQQLLWTVKYQPTAADQVCGNAAQVDQLRRWLLDWRDRIEHEPEEQQQAAAPQSPPAAGGRKQGGNARKRRLLLQDSDDELGSSLFGTSSLGAGDNSDGDWLQTPPSVNRRQLRSAGPTAAAAAAAGRSAGRRDSIESCDTELLYAAAVDDAPKGPCTTCVLSGPVGCGKTAAVYACAQELGFRVIEVHPGMDRNGVQLLKMVGEATQSGRVLARQRADGALTGKAAAQGAEAAAAGGQGGKAPQPVGGKKGKPAPGAAAGGTRPAAGALGAALRKGGKGAPPPATAGEVVDLSAAEHTVDVMAADLAAGAASNAAPGGRPSDITLILFDEADNLLDVDRGFLATLAALMAESKRPLVLCINGAALPPGLLQASSAVLHLPMERAPQAELLQLVVLVAAAERSPLTLPQLQAAVGDATGDVRAALTAAQFWSAAPGPVVSAAALRAAAVQAGSAAEPDDVDAALTASFAAAPSAAPSLPAVLLPQLPPAAAQLQGPAAGAAVEEQARQRQAALLAQADAALAGVTRQLAARWESIQQAAKRSSGKGKRKVADIQPDDRQRSLRGWLVKSTVGQDSPEGAAADPAAEAGGSPPHAGAGIGGDAATVEAGEEGAAAAMEVDGAGDAEGGSTSGGEEQGPGAGMQLDGAVPPSAPGSPAAGAAGGAPCDAAAAAASVGEDFAGDMPETTAATALAEGTPAAPLPPCTSSPPQQEPLPPITLRRSPSHVARHDAGSAAMAAAAQLAATLSACDALSTCHDPVAPVSGACPVRQQALPLLRAPVYLGTNAGLVSAMMQPDPPVRYVADALFNTDGLPTSVLLEALVDSECLGFGSTEPGRQAGEQVATSQQAASAMAAALSRHLPSSAAAAAGQPDAAMPRQGLLRLLNDAVQCSAPGALTQGRQGAAERLGAMAAIAVAESARALQQQRFSMRVRRAPRFLHYLHNLPDTVLTALGEFGRLCTARKQPAAVEMQAE